MIDAEFLRPRNCRDAQAANGVKDCDSSYSDKLAAMSLAFVDTSQVRLMELVSILFGSIVTRGLPIERDPREGIFIVFCLPILHVFEYGKEVLHTLSGQKADARDHTGNTPRGESAAGEADEDDLIAVDIVGADERVALPDMLATSSVTGRRTRPC